MTWSRGDELGKVHSQGRWCVEAGGPGLEERQDGAHGQLGGVPSVVSHLREPLKRGEGGRTLVKRLTSWGGKNWKRRTG